MRNIRNITINKAIIHVMDMAMEEPILNEKELLLTDETLDFIGKHIAKASSDDESKYAIFNGNNNIGDICRTATYKNDEFTKASQQIANIYFNIAKASGLIPSGDLLVVKFESEYGKMLAVINMIYNKTFIHSIDYENDEMVIDIKPQYIGLPDTMQRLQKCALINFEEDNGELLIIDRPTKCEKDSKNFKTFTDEILKCSLVDDNRDKTREFAKCSERWVRKNLHEDAGKAEEVRNEVTSALRNEDTIDIKQMANEMFRDENMSEKYLEDMKENGFDKKIEIDKEWVDKKLKKKKLKIDKDIEITVDANVYNDINRFQVKRNGDGTVDIIIRQVRNYFEKY